MTDIKTPPPETHVATPELAGIELVGVAEQLEQGAGAWRSCSGCHELIEGHPTGPWSETLKSYMGGGCRECGGIGAIWDSTDYSQVNDPPPMTTVAGISRELMGLIVDEVFDGAIEDASVIEEIYAVIKRHEAAPQHHADGTP